MIKAEQIPEEVVEAVAKSMGCEWAMQDKEDQIIVRRHIAAALTAWPGMLIKTAINDGRQYDTAINLPLQETQNAE